MIKRILFATDLSEGEGHVRAYVTELARALGSSVEMVHAIEPLTSDPDEHNFDDIYFDLMKRAERGLAALVEEFDDQGIRCSRHVEIAPRWQAIVERAQSVHADLIVMGSRSFEARTSSEPSTSHKVFIASHVPLLLVREQPAQPGAHAGAASAMH
jgi:nucleotide-binding universal stress UspA family protein